MLLSLQGVSSSSRSGEALGTPGWEDGAREKRQPRQPYVCKKIVMIMRKKSNTQKKGALRAPGENQQK